MTAAPDTIALPHARITLRHYADLLATYLRPQWPSVALMALLLFGSIALRLVGPQILRGFIDAVQRGGDARTLTSAALLFLSTAIGAQLVTALALYASEAVGWTATNRLRTDLTAHCLDLDFSFHQVHTPGELIERIDGDVNTLAGFFSQFVVQVLGNGALLVGILVLVAREDMRIGLLLAAYSALFLLIIGRMQAPSTHAFTRLSQAAAEASSFYGEQLGGLEDIAANGAGSYVMRQYYTVQRTVYRARLVAWTWIGIFNGAWEALPTLGTALALAGGAYLLSEGTMSLGTVFLLFSYTSLLIENATVLTQQFGDLQQATAGIMRIAELRNTRSRVQDGPGLDLPPGPLGVTLRAVSFGYTADRPALSDISFHLAPGETLGLLGHTGSGKTTLTRLLVRFADPDSGAVCLDGQDIRQARLDDLRGRVGLVNQDVHLFRATLRDNLTLFDPQIPDARLLAALAQIGLEDWYARLPLGLDTDLTDGGVSSGEAQLLAFARVFLRDPQLVVLDEASSRLDPATQALVVRATARLLTGRTGIIIAHRLTTVAGVDHILVLEGGRIVEYGPREGLARDPASRYARLLRTTDPGEVWA